MACDGIAVMSLKYGADNALLAEKGLQAVVNLLNKQNHTAILVSDREMVVDNYTIYLRQDGALVGSRVPQELLTKVKDCCDTIAGLLTQLKVAQQVAQNANVLSQTTTSNGSIVMRVVIGG